MPHRLGRPLRRRARQCSGRPRRPRRRPRIPFSRRVCLQFATRRQGGDAASRFATPPRILGLHSPYPHASCHAAHRQPSALTTGAAPICLTFAMPLLHGRVQSSVLPILVVPTVYPHRLHKDVCSLAPTACIRRASGLGKPSLLTHSKHRALRQRYQLQCVLSRSRLLRPRPAHRSQYQPAGSRL